MCNIAETKRASANTPKSTTAKADIQSILPSQRKQPHHANPTLHTIPAPREPRTKTLSADPPRLRTPKVDDHASPNLNSARPQPPVASGPCTPVSCPLICHSFFSRGEHAGNLCAYTTAVRDVWTIIGFEMLRCICARCGTRTRGADAGSGALLPRVRSGRYSSRVVVGIARQDLLR